MTTKGYYKICIMSFEIEVVFLMESRHLHTRAVCFSEIRRDINNNAVFLLSQEYYLSSHSTPQPHPASGDSPRGFSVINHSLPSF